MSSAMIGVVAMAVVGLLAHRERGRRRRSVAAESWPWLIGVVERELDLGGTDLATATVRACLTGPPPLRSAAERAVRAAGGTDPVRLVEALRDTAASAAGDRLFGMVAAVHLRTAPAAALVSARTAATAAAVHEDECTVVGAGGTAARWLLLAPVLPAAAGLLPVATGWGVAAAVVVLWWGAGRWLHEGREVRVFAAEPLGPRP